LLQFDWSMVRLRPNSVSSGCTETQFDCTPQSPQPSQTSSLMITRLPDLHSAALAAAALFGGAGLVVDQHRDALDSRSSLLHRVELVAVMDGDARRAIRIARILLRLVGDDDDALARLRLRTWCAICGTRQRAVDRLAAGHRDRVVVEDLVGDVDAGGDRLRGSPGSRNGCRCRRRGSGTRAFRLVNGASPIQSRPRRPCGEGVGVAVHPLRHVVAADAGQRALPSGTLVEVLCGQPEQVEVGLAGGDDAERARSANR
jgi:hypothetical protein